MAKAVGLKNMTCYLTHDASMLELPQPLDLVLEGWKLNGTVKEVINFVERS
jgi:hypothetical protein